MAQASDRRLIEAAARGETAALEALWQRERPRVAAVLLAHRPREEDLEDLLQEVGVILVERIHEVRRPESFAAWLRTVALNVARGAGRRRKVSRQRDRGARGDLESVVDPRDPHGERGRERIEAREELRQVLDWVRGLSPGYAEPLLLRSVWGMSQRDIAAWLGIPETTVETRLARARRTLREHVEASDRLRRAE